MTEPLTNCPRCGAPILGNDPICFACGQVVAEPGRVQELLEIPGDAAAATPPGVQPATAPTPVERPIGQVWTAGTEPPPWEDRRRYGFWLALWLTWRDSVFKPVPFFRKLPPRSGLGPAIGYTLLITAVALFFNFYWETVGTALSGGAEEGLVATLLGGLIAYLTLGVFLLVLYLGLLFLTVALIHLGFMVVGAGRMGYEATFRSTAYASGPAAFAIFPFFGPLLGLVWGSVVLFIAVREAQRTTNVRAALAFLMPLFVMTVFLFILGILFALLIGTADFSNL
jgi:hypothetical protein